MRRRILFAIILVTVFAIAVFGIPLGYAAAQIYRSQELTQLSQAATRAVGVVPSTGLGGADRIELPPTPSHMSLGLYDTNAVRVAGRGPQVGGSLSRTALAGSIGSGRESGSFAVTVPIVDEDQVVGFARAGVPTSVVTNRAHATWFGMAAFAVLIVLVAAGVARVLARHLSSPLVELAHNAEELGAGNVGIRTRRHGVEEIDDASAALDATARRLGDLLERERSFSADVSHQLSTPLTGLRLTLEAALMDDHADLHGVAESALVEVDRLQGTVEDLLRLARDTDAAKEVLDLPGYFAEIESLFHGMLANGGRPLRISLDEDLPELHGSRAATRQILNILVDNAYRHGAGVVDLQARGVGTGAVVEVSDEGDGIAGHMEYAFARRSPAAHGHGIGLALARSLAIGQGAQLILRHSGPRPTFALILPGNTVIVPDLDGASKEGLPDADLRAPSR